MNTLGVVDTLWQDLRFGLRLLRRTPGFTCVAVLSLALGIGANTAIFQLVDAVRLRTLPVRNPEQLVEVRTAKPRSRAGNFFSRYPELSNPQWEEIRARQEAFTGVLAWSPKRFDLSAGGEVRPVEGLAVSGSFFDVLGVPAARGRVFAPADDSPGCGTGGAVISHRFWQLGYGGDERVLGRTIRLGGRPFEIVGVTPETFHGVEVGRSFDVAIPICAMAALEPDAGLIGQSHVWWLSVMGRLRPGWTVERATAQLRAVSPSLFEHTLSGWFDPEAAKGYLALRLEAAPIGGGFSAMRAQYGAPLWLLLGLSGLVLLASCVNLANLTLARATARERELGVRLAAGAPRRRVVRQLLTESLLLATAGAAGGVVLAKALSGLVVTLLSTRQARVFVDLPLDWRVLGFAVLLVAATVLVFGLTPALRATAIPVHRLMQAGGGRSGTMNRPRLGLQSALVVVQVALSMAMVGSAVLFTLSLHRLATFETGHRVDGVLIADLAFNRENVPDARLPVLQQTLLERLRATPGITAAARTAIAPMNGQSMIDTIRVDGDGKVNEHETCFHRVDAGYFRTVGVRLAAGRDFDDRDRVGSKLVAVVNRTFATRLFSPSAALGRTFSVQTTPGTWLSYEIVGLAEDAVYSDVREPVPPVAYLALAQDPDPYRDPVVMVHSTLPAAVLRSAVARAVADVEASTRIEFSSLSEVVWSATQRERLLAALSAGFGVLALSLSAIGIYGVLSYLVARRRQEIGVRLALGATRSDIVRMVAAQSLGWVGAGLGLGALLAVLTATAARSMLFGLTPTNPLALVIAAAALATTGLAATIVPAIRAARLHPTTALRQD